MEGRNKKGEGKRRKEKVGKGLEDRTETSNKRREGKKRTRK